MISALIIKSDENNDYNNNLKGSISYSPPYSSEPVTKEYTNDDIGEVKADANRLTGYIGGGIDLVGLGRPYINPALGSVESYQVIDFNLDQKKTVDIEALINVSVMDIDIFNPISVTKIRVFVDDQECFTKVIEPLVGLDEYVDAILFCFGLTGSIPSIISNVATIAEITTLIDYLVFCQDQGYSLSVPISFRLKNMEPGTHQIKIGCYQDGMCWNSLQYQKSTFIGQVSYVNLITNNPPIKPILEGPNEVKVDRYYTYTVSTTDPENDQIRYGFDFNGDKKIDVWTDFCDSGQNKIKNKIWNEPGEFLLSVIAEDTKGSISEFSDQLHIVVNLALAPSMPERPSGESNGVINNEYLYYTSSTDPNGDDLSYKFDWGDGTYSDWIGLYESGKEMCCSHTWTDPGEYRVKAISKDTDGMESYWSTPLYVQITDGNNKPLKPTIHSGSTFNKVIEDLPYFLNLSSVDEDNDLIYYHVKWGDGTDDSIEEPGKDSPHNSGESVVFLHNYEDVGSYTIKCKATDEHGAESYWTTFNLEVKTKNKNYDNFIFAYLFQRVHTIINTFFY